MVRRAGHGASRRRLAGVPAAISIVVIVVTAAVACAPRPGTWTAVDAPAKGQWTPNVTFGRIRCGGASSCLALGNQEGDALALAAAWDGTSWRMVTPPPVRDPGGFACASPTWCAVFSRYDNRTYAVWDGTAWTTAATTPQDPDGLSCPAPNVCFNSFGEGRIAGDRSLFRWDGAAWSLVDGTEQPAFSRDLISCPTVDTCLVVAVIDHPSGSVMLRWHDGVMTPVPVTGPPARLDALDCPAEDRCVMSGRAIDPANPYYGIGEPVLAAWTGGDVVVTPQVPAPAAPAAWPMAVSCTGPSACLGTSAAGNAVFDGTGWHAVAGAGRGGAAGAALDCASATVCFALPLEGVLAPQLRASTRVQRWDGTAWVDLGPPEGAVVPRPEATFQAVGCSAAAACLALGTYRVDGVHRALAETWDGTRWTPVADPPVPEQSLDRAFLAIPPTVDCGSASACVAGFNTLRSDLVTSDPLLAAWDGTSWTPSPVTAMPATEKPRVDDVACAGPRWCLAVGVTTVVDAETRPYARPSFAEIWDGTTWSPAPAPPPDPLIPLDRLNDRPVRVSCATPTYCGRLAAGVGDRGLPIPSASSVVHIWDGTGWTVTPEPPLPYGARSYQPFDIDCPAPGTCVSTGLAVPVSSAVGGMLTVAARWNGTAWTVHYTAMPSIASTRRGGVWQGSRADTVSCLTPTRCLALLTSAGERNLTAVDLRWGDGGGGFSSALTTPDAPGGPEARSVTNALACTPQECEVVGATTVRTATTPVGFRYRLAGEG